MISNISIAENRLVSLGSTGDNIVWLNTSLLHRKSLVVDITKLTIVCTQIIIRYHESSTTTCFLEPWFREIGFAFTYGSIVIKVYRIYAEFQTRKAHRVCVRDKDLLKYLFGIVLIVFGYMSAWTALVIDGIDNIKSFNLFGSSFNFTSKNILDIKYAQNGLKFYVCRQLAWDYVTEIGELHFFISRKGNN